MSVPQRTRRLRVGLLPEPRDERAQQELLGQAHARVRRHLEGAHLQQAEPAAAAVGRVELVDAELGAMRVAGGVDEQMAEEAVHEPGRDGRAPASDFRPMETGCEAGRRPVAGPVPKRDFQFVERIVARLVHARALAGRADEQAAEQKRERRVILPVREQAPQQIRPAQQRAVRGRRAADDDVVAAAGAGVAAIDHELLRAQPRLARFLVKHRGVVHEFVPVGGRMDVHLDDAGIGRDLEHVEARIGRRRVAFDDDGRAELRRRCLRRRRRGRDNPPASPPAA